MTRWLLVASVAVGVAVALLIHEGVFDSGPSVSGQVGRVHGRPVDCSTVGFMLVAGKRDSVYACIDQTTGRPTGCWVVDSGLVVDESRAFRAIVRAQGQSPPC